MIHNYHPSGGHREGAGGKMVEMEKCNMLKLFQEWGG
jgi:hypothetical protein